MSAKAGLNTRSSATKRILQEHREFLADPSPEFVAHPLEDDIFEWHVTVRGVENSEYAGGKLQHSSGTHRPRPGSDSLFHRDLPPSNHVEEPIPYAGARHLSHDPAGSIRTEPQDLHRWVDELSRGELETRMGREDGYVALLHDFVRT